MVVTWHHSQHSQHRRRGLSPGQLFVGRSQQFVPCACSVLAWKRWRASAAPFVARGFLRCVPTLRLPPLYTSAGKVAKKGAGVSDQLAVRSNAG